MRRSRFTIGLLLGSMLSLLAHISCSDAGAVSVRDAWIRLPPPGANTAVFMKIDNTYSVPKYIVEVGGDKGFEFQLHETTIDNGMARMAKLETLEIPAHGTKDLRPRGIHIMLKAPPSLQQGQKINMWLLLKDEKRVPLTATVSKVPLG